MNAVAKARALPLPLPAPRVPAPKAVRLAAGHRVAWIMAAIVITLAFAAPLDAKPLARTIHPLAAQTSDEAIAGDLALLDAWRGRLDGLVNAGEDPWRVWAARAWLHAASEEYTNNDRTGFPQAAFARAVTLIDELEQHATPTSHETVPAASQVSGSAHIADSLYVSLERMKRDPGFRCAAEELAVLEVELAWAGNEQVDQGDCFSAPHLVVARDLILSARLKEESCGASLPGVRQVKTAPKITKLDTVAVPSLVIPTAEQLQIPRNVHFALNQFDITPTSQRVIAGIAALLKEYPSITARLEGHTDSRGDTTYNLNLSRRRVMAARAVFLALGIDSTRLSIAYKGKSDLLAVEDSKRGFALNRRVEMVFVDSEGRDIKVSRQEEDLQLEGDRPARRALPGKGVRPRATPGGKPGVNPGTGAGAKPGAVAKPKTTP